MAHFPRKKFLKEMFYFEKNDLKEKEEIAATLVISSICPH